MTVRLTDDVYWIERCHDEDGAHLHVSAYLITAESGNVLIDSGAHGDDAVLSAVDRLTDGEGVDTVLFTHTSLPHTGNAGAFYERGARVVSSTTILGEMGMDYAEEWLIEQSPEIHGRTFSFVEPVFSDHVFSQWIFDHGSGVLFPSETFGNYHEPGQCDLRWETAADAIDVAGIDEYCRKRIPGLQYVEAEAFVAALQSRIEDFDIEYVAPAHGNPIAGEHVDEYVDRLSTVGERLSQDWLYFRMND